MPRRVPLGKCADAGPGNFKEHYGLRRMRLYTFARTTASTSCWPAATIRGAPSALWRQPREEPSRWGRISADARDGGVWGVFIVINRPLKGLG